MWKLKLLSVLMIGIWTAGIQAAEDNLYDFLWLDPDKSVYVLQNKVHKKERTVYADVGYLMSMTGSFQDTTGYAVKVGYYFHEEWAVEGLYLGYQNSNNENFKNVQLLNEGVPFVRKPVSTTGVGIVYSPFYGKINTFNKIIYFDWSFGAGVAKVTTKSNLKSVTSSTQSDSYRNENNTGGYLKSSLKFHLSQNWHLGVEWIGTYYKAPGPKNPKQDKVRSQNDLILQLGYSY